MAGAAEDDVLLAMLRIAMGVSVRAADAVDSDVSTVQLRALTLLSREPGCNLGRLAESMGVALSTASRLVERLVAADLVDRRTAETNRREVALTLTPHGARTLSRYDALRIEGMHALLDRLPDGDRETVLAGLRVLTAADPWGLPPVAG